MNKTHTFCQDVKEEIVSKKYSDERSVSLLSSFVRSNGSLLIRNNREYIVLRIENSKIAKYIYSLFCGLYSKKPTISYVRNNKFSKKTCYIISVDDATLLKDLHYDTLSDKIDKYFYKNNERIGGFLSGVFLACGSVNSPRNSNYHLELSSSNYEFCNELIKFIKAYKDTNINLKLIRRRKKYVCYLKRSDQIVDFLILIGATDACLYFENLRVDRDFSNVMNRYNNLDTANYQKTIKSAYNDANIIKKLIEKKGKSFFGSEKVALIAEYRIKFPEDSLQDLSNKVSDKLGYKVSKSNINHILRNFRNIYKNL